LWTDLSTHTYPEGTLWNVADFRLDVRTADLLEDMIVPGRISTRNGFGGGLVTLRNVRAHDVWTFEIQRVKIVEDCEFIMPASRVEGGWGQGAINILAADFEVRRTRMEGAADCMQLNTAGIVEDSFLGNMTIAGDPGTGTHNDFVQAYGGTDVTFTHCWFYQLCDSGDGSHVNGIFSDGGTVNCVECPIEVYKPVGQSNWTLHTGKANAVDMTLTRCLIRGDYVGDEFVFVDCDFED
jgi:hypothetical protein